MRSNDVYFVHIPSDNIDDAATAQAPYSRAALMTFRMLPHTLPVLLYYSTSLPHAAAI